MTSHVSSNGPTAYEHAVWMASIYIRGMLAYGAFEPCCFLIVWWAAHAVTCTYLKVLRGQTRQLKWRDSLTQGGFSLLLLFLLLLVQHHSCHLQQLGLNSIKSENDYICGTYRSYFVNLWIIKFDLWWFIISFIKEKEDNTLRASLRDAEIFDFFYKKAKMLCRNI